MKNAAKTPGKLLAGLCLILFFCLMPVRSYAAEQQLSEITKLYVTGIYGSEHCRSRKSTGSMQIRVIICVCLPEQI